MAGLVPGIHVLAGRLGKKGVDGNRTRACPEFDHLKAEVG